MSLLLASAILFGITLCVGSDPSPGPSHMTFPGAFLPPAFRLLVRFPESTSRPSLSLILSAIQTKGNPFGLLCCLLRHSTSGKWSQSRRCFWEARNCEITERYRYQPICFPPASRGFCISRVLSAPLSDNEAKPNSRNNLRCLNFVNFRL
jgi:hypothetical protein